MKKKNGVASKVFCAALAMVLPILALDRNVTVPLQVGIDYNCVAATGNSCYGIVHLKLAGRPVSGAVVKQGAFIFNERTPGSGVYANYQLPFPQVGQNVAIFISKGLGVVTATATMKNAFRLLKPQIGQVFSRSQASGIAFNWDFAAGLDTLHILIDQAGVSAPKIVKDVQGHGFLLSFSELNDNAKGISAILFLKASDTFVFTGPVARESGGAILFRAEVNCTIQ
jgi:hypothetical protein